MPKMTNKNKILKILKISKSQKNTEGIETPKIDKIISMLETNSTLTFNDINKAISESPSMDETEKNKMTQKIMDLPII